MTFISNFLDVDTSDTVFGVNRNKFVTDNIGLDIDKYFLS